MMARSRFKPPYRSNLTDLMIFKNRWWQHLLFWIAALLVLFNIFKSSGSVEKIDIIYTLIFLVPVVCIVYLNLYLALPRFLGKERYLLYILTFLILLTGGALFLYLLFDSLIDLVLPGFYFISYYSVPVLMLYTGSFLILTTLLKLSRSWFMLLRLERNTTTHQLQSLQSQINPHFLLNSLQTIYALSLEASSRTPEVILQLSHILKYTLYETGQPTVQLRKELDMIRDYVDMYRHRVDPERTKIKLDINGDPGKLLIAPMLLIPFIENSFKHGLGEEERSIIRIAIFLTGNTLEFNIENNYRPSQHMELKQGNGIGIGNTRKRLELLYPGSHRLVIERPDNVFKVKLTINLKESNGNLSDR
jgi:sensor histidine kinase YesM